MIAQVLNNQNAVEMQQVIHSAVKNQFRLLMNLNDVCFGKCEGCGLSERLTVDDFDFEKIEVIFDAVGAFLKNHECDSLLLNFGIGDYLSLSVETLDRLGQLTRLLEKKIEKPVIISISTSILFRDAGDGKKRLSAFVKHLNKDQIHLEIVVDPKKLRKSVWVEQYIKNINDLSEVICAADLVVNLCADLGAEDAKNVIEVLQNTKILSIDMVYNLQQAIENRVEGHGIVQSDFREFFSELQKVPETRGVLNLGQACVDENLSLLNLITDYYKMTRSWGFAVNQKGLISYVAYGIGDVIIPANKDYEIGRVDFERRKIVFFENNKIPRLALNMVSKAPCSDCKYQKKCFGTAYWWYQLYSKSGVCDNPALVLYEKGVR